MSVGVCVWRFPAAVDALEFYAWPWGGGGLDEQGPHMPPPKRCGNKPCESVSNKYSVPDRTPQEA
eukprot:5360349-Lingulodinium_polyedra.AAC.1